MSQVISSQTSNHEAPADSDARVARELANLLSNHITVTASSSRAGGVPVDVVMRLMVMPELRKMGVPFGQLTPDQRDALLTTLAQRIVSFDGERRALFLYAARQIR